MTHIHVETEDTIDVLEFAALAQVAWGTDLDLAKTAMALTRTINITARAGEELVGTVRILTDGYLFGTVPELMVHPDWRGQGVARGLMEAAWEASPTGLYLGAQPGLEEFYTSLGYSAGLPSFQRKKPRG